MSIGAAMAAVLVRFGAAMAAVLQYAHWLAYFIAYVSLCAIIQAFFDWASLVWLDYAMSGLYVFMYAWSVRDFIKAFWWRLRVFCRGHEQEPQQISEKPLSRRIFETEGHWILATCLMLSAQHFLIICWLGWGWQWGAILSTGLTFCMYVGVVTCIQELFEANLLLLVSFFLLFQKLRLLFRAIDHAETSQILFGVLSDEQDQEHPWKTLFISQISMIDLYQFVDKQLADITRKIVANVRQQPRTDALIEEWITLSRTEKTWQLLQTRLHTCKWLFWSWMPIMLGVLFFYFCYKLALPIAWGVAGWADELLYSVQEGWILDQARRHLNEPLPDYSFDEE
jgi:hypothetical protein